jgi:hypothetical protein
MGAEAVEVFFFVFFPAAGFFFAADFFVDFEAPADRADVFFFFAVVFFEVFFLAMTVPFLLSGKGRMISRPSNALRAARESTPD